MKAHALRPSSLPLLLAPLALGAAACGFVETHEVVLRPTPGPATHPVELYMGDQRPARSFYEIALLQVVGHGSDANLEDLTRGLSERAAQLGCDAVVHIKVDQGYTSAHAFGVCVSYTSAPAVSTSTPPPTPTPTLTPTPKPAPPPSADSGDVTL